MVYESVKELDKVIKTKDDLINKEELEQRILSTKDISKIVDYALQYDKVGKINSHIDYNEKLISRIMEIARKEIDKGLYFTCMSLAYHCESKGVCIYDITCNGIRYYTPVHYTREALNRLIENGECVMKRVRSNGTLNRKPIICYKMVNIDDF